MRRLFSVFILVIPAAFAQSPALRIVVVEGEAGINIVQQRTAVAPVVEVRDRNDQPVSGAVVTFAIRGGRATFAGARTLSVTTNAAGRAVAVGLTPTGAGAVQISAAAAFQGQTAAVTIAQTNVMNAAQAASAAAAGGAGGGGGIGVGTLAAIGAGVAGAAVGYQQVQAARQGDPPEMGSLEMVPRSGFQNATTFAISGSIAAGSGDPNVLDARLRCEWGDGTSETRSMSLGPEAQCRHAYSSSGTFTVRQTVIDHWDRTASAETTVTVVSMSGRWTASAGTGGVYELAQNGATITGTLIAPSGTAAVSGSVSTGAFTSAGGDPGRISLSLPLLIGPTIVPATFSGTMPGDGDVNRVFGGLSGANLGGRVATSLNRQ